jgi:hypothetical protein
VRFVGVGVPRTVTVDPLRLNVELRVGVLRIRDDFPAELDDPVTLDFEGVRGTGLLLTTRGLLVRTLGLLLRDVTVLTVFGRLAVLERVIFLGALWVFVGLGAARDRDELLDEEEDLDLRWVPDWARAIWKVSPNPITNTSSRNLNLDMACPPTLCWGKNLLKEQRLRSSVLAFTDIPLLGFHAPKSIGGGEIYTFVIWFRNVRNESSVVCLSVSVG